MKLAISIVVYNESESSFKNCLDLCNKIDAPTKIFVYDNSPSPKLKKIADEYQISSYTHDSSNIGFGAAHNKNFIFSKKEKCNALLILNCDAMEFSKIVPNMMKILNKNINVGGLVPFIIDNHNKVTDNVRFVMNIKIFITRMIKFLLTGKRVIPEIQKIYNEKFNTNQLIKIPCAAGCFLLVRSNIFEKVKGFDENFFLYCEDIDLTRRIAGSEQNLFLDLSSKIKHHGRRSSHINKKLFFVHVISLLKYFKKWGIFDFKANNINKNWLNYLNDQ